MINERNEELASLYALDLLEGSERSAFEQQLASNAELRKRVDELRETSAQLALTAPSPPPSPELRDRIFASIDSLSRASEAGAPAAPDNVVSFRLASWLGWAAAAAFAIVALWIGQRYSLTQKELTAVQTLAEVEKAAAQSVRNQLEAERLIAMRQTNDFKKAQADVGTLRESLASERSQAARQLAALQGKYDLANFKVSRLASLLDNSPEATAIAVWNPVTQEGVLSVEKLPALASNQDYQLWVIDPQYPAPVNGGVFVIDAASGTGQATFRPRKPIAQATKFAISRERKGGVEGSAEGPIIMISP